MGLSKRTKLLLLFKRRYDERSREKRIWVGKLFQDRKKKGEFHLLILDMRLHDADDFFKYCRMNSTHYEFLLSKVAPLIQKSSKRMECIGPSERLYVTIRYVSTAW